jgi:hypothetical protein
MNVSVPACHVAAVVNVGLMVLTAGHLLTCIHDAGMDVSSAQNVEQKHARCDPTRLSAESPLCGTQRRRHAPFVHHSRLNYIWPDSCS